MMRTKTIIKYLEKARNLISDKNNWCQGALAKDKDGNHVTANDRLACKFCALGAINKACPSGPSWSANTDTLQELLDKSLPSNYNFIENLNDSNLTPHSHRRVIGTFNRAIKKLESAL